MSIARYIPRRLLCFCGMHAAPEARYPYGAMVADCPSCGKTCFYQASPERDRGEIQLLAPSPCFAALPPSPRQESVRIIEAA